MRRGGKVTLGTAVRSCHTDRDSQPDRKTGTNGDQRNDCILTLGCFIFYLIIGLIIVSHIVP